MARVGGGPGGRPGLAVAREDRGGQRVEVVLVGEQQDRGDALQFGALAGGRGEQLARREFEAGLP